MKRSSPRSVRWILAAAIAGPAVALLGSSARAQYLVPNQGQAHDSNQRLGSNGTYGVIRSQVGVTQNQIVSGNVTNNKQFRGPVASGDARAFRGETADDNSDRFIRASAGGYDNKTLAQAYETRAYYGNSRAVAAPANYSSPVATGTNVYRTGTPTYGQSLSGYSLSTMSTGENLLPTLGSNTTVIGGPSDLKTGLPSSYLIMSPLGGIRQVSPDQLRGSTLGGGTLYGSPNSGDRFGTSGDFLNKVRTETGEPGANSGLPAVSLPGTPAAPAPLPGAPTPPIPGGPQPLNRPLNAPESPLPSPIGGTPMGTGPNGAAPVGQPLPSGASTGQTIRTTTSVPPTPQMNQQQSILQQRLQQAQQGDQTPTDQQVAQQQRLVRPLNAPAAPGTPAKPGTPAVPGTPTPPAVPAVPSVPATPGAGAAKVEPLVITSLADGVKSPTLAAKLRDAETDMKAGKFADAMEKYTLAEAASPKDPLIALGRANAELGSGSYRTAEMHLRDAFAANPELLMGKYDLKTLIGQERINTLAADLKELSGKEPQETLAPFLLAYLNYNTGHETDVAAQLAEVEKREGGAADPVVKAMKQRWSLPASNLNK